MFNSKVSIVLITKVKCSGPEYVAYEMHLLFSFILVTAVRVIDAINPKDESWRNGEIHKAAL